MHPDDFEKLKKIRKKQVRKRYEIIESEKKEKIALKKLLRNEKISKKLQLNQRKLKNPNELKFRDYLKANNINYIWQQPFFDIDRYVCVDFYLSDYNMVVEIDGLIHEDQKQKDFERTMYLKKKHNVIKVIRFTNKNVLFNPDLINNKLRDIKDNYIINQWL